MASLREPAPTLTHRELFKGVDDLVPKETGATLRAGVALFPGVNTKDAAVGHRLLAS